MAIVFVAAPPLLRPADLRKGPPAPPENPAWPGGAPYRDDDGDDDE